MSSIVEELRGMGPGPNIARLIAVATGMEHPPKYSRLGAFKAVLGHAQGTVGYAVTRAIAAIYITLGEIGQDEIGLVFNSPEAQSLLDGDACGPASKKLAELEFGYWNGQDTLGGFLGSQFNPTVRTAMQCGFGQL